jgi:hypothetical protein
MKLRISHAPIEPDLTNEPAWEHALPPPATDRQGRGSCRAWRTVSPLSLPAAGRRRRIFRASRFRVAGSSKGTFGPSTVIDGARILVLGGWDASAGRISSTRAVGSSVHLVGHSPLDKEILHISTPKQSSLPSVGSGNRH